MFAVHGTNAETRWALTSPRSHGSAASGTPLFSPWNTRFYRPSPPSAPYDTQGYLFGAVVGHPVTVT